MAVGITFSSISHPPTTPVTRNSSSQKAFDTDYYLTNAPNLSLRDRLAIAIVGLTHYNNAYKTTHPALIQDAMVFFGGISEKFDVAAMQAAIYWSAGKKVDATLSTDVPTLLSEGRDFAALPEDQLWRIWLFMRMENLL